MPLFEEIDRTFMRQELYYKCYGLSAFDPVMRLYNEKKMRLNASDMGKIKKHLFEKFLACSQKYNDSSLFETAMTFYVYNDDEDLYKFMAGIYTQDKKYIFSYLENKKGFSKEDILWKLAFYENYDAMFSLYEKYKAYPLKSLEALMILKYLCDNGYNRASVEWDKFTGSNFSYYYKEEIRIAPGVTRVEDANFKRYISDVGFNPPTSEDMKSYFSRSYLNECDGGSQLNQDLILIDAENLEGNEAYSSDKRKSFYMSDHQCTRKEYYAVMLNSSETYIVNPDLPYNITWIDAVNYCNKKSKEEGLECCYSEVDGKIVCNFNANGYRLPTESEWIYAAKGGNKSNHYLYSGSNNLDEVGWYSGNSLKHIHPVMQKKPNEIGIYDLSGNLMEWCWDSYGDETKDEHIAHGGCWNSDAEECGLEQGCHFSNKEDECAALVGFRIVRSRM